MKTKQLLFGLFLTVALTANAATYYVRSTGDDASTTPTLVGSPLLTVSAALAKASTDGDVIDIAGSVNYFGATIATKTITKNITIQGDNNTTAIVSGVALGTGPAMQIGSSAVIAPRVTIQNLTFQNFDSFANGNYVTGGVIYLQTGTLNCSNVNFLNNTAYSGGAIYVTAIASDAAITTATFQDCYFYNNQAKKVATNKYADGGAVSIVLGGTDNNKVNVDFEKCLFDANTAEDAGSALRCRFQSLGTGASTLLVQNCTFANNVNKNGGLNTGSQVSGKGVIITEGNGGVTQTNGDMKFINNTIAYNTNQTNGTSSGFFNASCLNMITLINNIVFSNTNPFLVSGAPQSLSFVVNQNFKETRNNVSDYTTGLQYQTVGGTATGLTSGNVASVTAATLKLDAALTNNGGSLKTIALLTGSSAINTGYTTGVPTMDQRGYLRDVTPDKGAYEVNGTITADLNPQTKSVNVYQAGNNTITMDLTGLTGLQTVTIFNMQGRSIIIRQTTGGEKFSMAANLKNAMYIVRIQGAEKAITSKLIIR